MVMLQLDDLIASEQHPSHDPHIGAHGFYGRRTSRLIVSVFHVLSSSINNQFESRVVGAAYSRYLTEPRIAMEKIRCRGFADGL